MITTRYHCGWSVLVAVLAIMLLIGTGTVLAQLNGQIPMPGKSIPRFVDPLPTFVGLRVDAATQPNLTVRMKEFSQQVLSTGTLLGNGTTVSATNGTTRVWTYEINGGIKHYPSLTIEARRGIPVQVTYFNDLVAPTLYSPIGTTPGIIPVDQTIHWAAPTGMRMMDMGPYTGDVPVVPHLHGGEVSSKSDGGPEGWFTPNFAITGPTWHLAAPHAVSNVYNYPNTQEGATLWYHDHALGATRLNVYAGLAGFYFLRDLNTMDTGIPTAGGLPAGPYEIEMAIQDRMFDTQGQLYFPNVGLNPTMHPYWNPEFFGDVIVVNGKTWPFLTVEPRRYRFRIVEGSNARFYEMWLQNVATGGWGPPIYQIGTDGGLLDRPVKIDPALAQHMLMAPGERADIIVDFSAFAGQTLTLKNGAKAPFPKGAAPDPKTTGQIMQFRVTNPVALPVDNSYNPALGGTLRTPLVRLVAPNAIVPAVTVDKTRLLTLNEVMGPLGPLEILVNNAKWVAPTTETPQEGHTEIWKIVNLTADVHPIHLHLVQFQLVSRQPFNATKYNKAYAAAFPGGSALDPMTGSMMTYLPGVFMPGYGPPLNYNTGVPGILGGNPDVTPFLQGAAVPAGPEEQGWKDTFKMWPGQVTTVIVRFAPTDLATTTPKANLRFAFNVSEGPGYVWHCHIVDHEDNEMMRPYSVSVNPLPTQLPATLAESYEAAVDADVAKPAAFALSQNYPNPFNPSTDIRFELPQDSHVRLTLYNSLGQEVKTLINADAPAGYHSVKLDAGNLASGTYFYRLEAGSFVANKKMLLIK